MDIGEELIQRIEEEVKKVLGQESIPASSSTSDKRLLAIFDAAEVDLAQPLQQLEKCIQGGYATTAILSDLAAAVFDTKVIQSICGEGKFFKCGEIANLSPFIEGFSLIAIPILSYSMAAKLALGMVDTPCTYLIFQAILRGDRVIATSDILERVVRTKTPFEVSKLGQNHLKTLSNFGIQFVTVEQLSETILSDNSLSFGPVDAKGGKAVISASVIANLAPAVREFVYSNPAVITPSARDLAAQRGIRLVEKSK